MQTPEQRERLKHVFFPYASAAAARIKADGGRFVYYTIAETAYCILKNREIWMRNTMTMNDYMDVRHGLSCIVDAYRSGPGERLNAALDACFPGVASEIRQLFRAWVPGIPRDTFVTCFSEHKSEEDEHGRLSMWRAYGGQAGVALVLKGEATFKNSNALAVYSSPVAYMYADQVAVQVAQVAESIASNIDLVRTMGRDGVKNAVFHMLRFAAVCTKHGGFREELEWRVVASPAIQSSDLLPLEVEVVRGVPQVVLKIKLKNDLEHGLTHLALPEILDRVVIGPCQYPDVIQRAIHHLLTDAGVRDPDTKISVSNIPLRAV